MSREPGPTADDPVKVTRQQFKAGGRKVMTISKDELALRERAWQEEQAQKKEQGYRHKRK